MTAATAEAGAAGATATRSRGKDNVKDAHVRVAEARVQLLGGKVVVGQPRLLQQCEQRTVCPIMTHEYVNIACMCVC